ncbi:MAG TPA: alpha/beta hydrolase [Candidatus Binatia bacterium]
MTIPVAFLVVSLIGAWFTFNAYNPMLKHRRRSVISFFAGWLTVELALHHIAWQVLATCVFIHLGALAEWPGRLGLAISIASWAALALLYRRATQAEEVVEQALRRGLGENYRERILPEFAEQLSNGIDWREILLPFPMRDPRVERLRNIPYAENGKRPLLLDLYRPRQAPPGPGGEAQPEPRRLRPILLQIHGGAWILGSKNEQGIPLMLRMASHGWLCASIDYRLSPRATFPDHIVDVKRAIRWLKEHALEYGADPNFIVVTGGSAGGHLASLAALTPNAPEFQPGFEDVDTTVQGCVSFYGVYDFTNRNGVYAHDGLSGLLSRWVMKKRLSEARELYEQASPLYRIGPQAPPFFLVHGDCDSLVPVGEARHFYAALREASHNHVVYAEIPGAQHAFELFPSLRSALAIDGVERFLFVVYSEHLRATETDRTQSDASEPRKAAAS